MRFHFKLHARNFSNAICWKTARTYSGSQLLSSKSTCFPQKDCFEGTRIAGLLHFLISMYLTIILYTTIIMRLNGARDAPRALLGKSTKLAMVRVCVYVLECSHGLTDRSVRYRQTMRPNSYIRHLYQPHYISDEPIGTEAVKGPRQNTHARWNSD